MSQFSLVFMPQERGPRQKTRLMTDVITFGVGNSTILNQDGNMKILSHVACFYSKCVAKMKNERPAWQCFLTMKPFAFCRMIVWRGSWRGVPNPSSQVKFGPNPRSQANFAKSPVTKFSVCITALFPLTYLISSTILRRNLFRRHFYLPFTISSLHMQTCRTCPLTRKTDRT